MTIKDTKKTSQHLFPECALTGVVFDGQSTPLRLTLDTLGDTVELSLSLTDKPAENALLIDVNPKLINDILSRKRTLPAPYHSLIQQDFKEKIIELYTKKTYNSLSFLLKSGQAVIGRRAIDRSMLGYGDKRPLALLLAKGGSQAICKSFQFKRPDLKIIENFPQDLLIQVTGREKISYYCVLNTSMGITFLNDYTKYLKLSG